MQAKSNNRCSADLMRYFERSSAAIAAACRQRELDEMLHLAEYGY